MTTGVTIYVDDDGPNDPGRNDPNVSDPLEDGSEAHPFDTIQEALDLASQDTLVQILPGLYTERMDVPVSGCRIAGSGVEQTLVRQPSGQVLNAERLGNDSYLGPLPALKVRDLSLEGSLEINNLRYSLYRPFPSILIERASLKGDLSIGGFSSEIRITDVAMRGGGFTLSTFNSSYIVATLASLDAPDTMITLSVSAEASTSLNLSDSTLSGISWRGNSNAHGLFIDARNTRFTGDGIASFSAGACLHVVAVEDCLFEAGGIHVAELSAGYSACNGSLGRTSVKRSRFLDAGVVYEAVFGYQDNSLPGDFLAEFDSNEFSGSGIMASLEHGFVSSTGSAALRITNNIFESDGRCLSVNWGVDNTDASDLPADFRLEVVNNTFARCGTGLSLTTNPHPAGLNNHFDVIANNILEGGSIGVSTDGILDHDVSIAGNDVHGQSDGAYVGDLPDQTGLNGNIAVDPRFVDPNAGDYTLRPDSPCIDAGWAGPAVPATDYDGASRPQDGNGDGFADPDIGAFEFRPDADGDGFTRGDDCDDLDPSVHPGAPDLPGNTVDENCDGALACDPTDSWKTHGQFVQCVARACGALVKSGQVTGARCQTLITHAAQSQIGSRLRRRSPAHSTAP